MTIDTFTHNIGIKKTMQQDKCKCKKFGCVNVNDLPLDGICMPYL